MEENPFYYAERSGNHEADNLIIYNAGPIKVAVCGYEETITLKVLGEQ
jgi:hypothetical protein